MPDIKGIDKVVAYLQKSELGHHLDPLRSEHLLGLSFVLLGVFALCTAMAQHCSALRNLERRDFEYEHRSSLGLMVGFALMAIGLMAFVVMFLKG